MCLSENVSSFMVSILSQVVTGSDLYTCAPSYSLKVTSVTLFPPMSVAPGRKWGILSSPKHFLVHESMVLHNVDRLGIWKWHFPACDVARDRSHESDKSSNYDFLCQNDNALGD